MKKAFYSIALAVIAFVVFVAWKIIEVDTFAEIPRQTIGTFESAGNNFTFSSCLEKANSIDTPYHFLSNCYLDSSDTRNISVINSQLIIMDSITGDRRFNRITLSNALTRDLSERMSKKWGVYEPDTLLVLLQWAEQFQYYAVIYNNDKIFYHSIYGYWLNFIANKLTTFSYERPSLKYDFKFKYLLTRCKEQNFTMSIKVTSWEKFLENIIYSNWGHLLNATWNQSGWLLKAGLLIFLLTFFYGAIALVRNFYNLIKYRK